MTAATTKSVFRAGIRDGLPFIFIVIPFATLFGVVAIEAGLSLAQTMGFTVLVIAGAAQFAAVQLMLDNAAIGFVLLAALAVNLRMAMYSASLATYIGDAPLWQRALVSYLNFDQSYMMAMSKYEDSPDMSVSDRVYYFLGISTVIAPIWTLTTLIGALIGSAIPDAMALDFILPIAFLSMVAPMVRTLAHLAAALMSILVALLLIGLPSGSGLLIAAVCAMAAGVAVESWMERARA
ncbi:AzlC family ABC transporter permease [Yoonia sp. MH D7]